jgi:hypothetical protein
MHTPYTYLIGWSKHRKYYYGVRFAKGCAPSDLWKTYFTSSKEVKEFAYINGSPDIISIRRIFKDVNEAREYEGKVLKRLNAASRSDFLNKANGKSIPLEFSVHKGIHNGMFGKSRSEEFKANMRKPKTESHKANMKGPRPLVDQKGKNNNAFKGYIHTPFGVFTDLKSAANIENVHYGTIAYRIHNKSNSNYWRE